MGALRRIISFVLFICIVLLLPLGVSAEGIEPTEDITREELRNYESTQGYSKLFESFELIENTADPSFPELYGGAYINDSGTLVIQTVENRLVTEKEKKLFEMNSLCAVTELQEIKIEKVNYSYNELLTTNNELSAIILDGTVYDLDTAKEERVNRNLLGYEIVMCGIDAKNNAVVVWLSDTSKETIQSFREEVIDAPYLDFKLASKERPRLEIAYESGGGNINGGSIGFPATSGSYTGFVTAWHCSVAGKNYLGATAYGIRSGNAAYDYAFIRNTGSSDTISRELFDTNKVLAPNIYSHPIQGSAIGRTGKRSGYDSGEVLYTGVTMENLGSDLYHTNCSSRAGDSGGPYFTSPSSSTVSLAGIHIGGYDGARDETFFRGISYIYNAGYRIQA